MLRVSFLNEIYISSDIKLSFYMKYIVWRPYATIRPQYVLQSIQNVICLLLVGKYDYIGMVPIWRLMAIDTLRWRK